MACARCPLLPTQTVHAGSQRRRRSAPDPDGPHAAGPQSHRRRVRGRDGGRRVTSDPRRATQGCANAGWIDSAPDPVERQQSVDSLGPASKAFVRPEGSDRRECRSWRGHSWAPGRPHQNMDGPNLSDLAIRTPTAWTRLMAADASRVCGRQEKRSLRARDELTRHATGMSRGTATSACNGVYAIAKPSHSEEVP
jgi:hypothetical protein